MSIESRRHQYGKLFGHWQIKEFLGSGSQGKSAVFRLEHTESTSIESALKVVSLIEERGSIDNLSPERRKEYEAARKSYSEEAEHEILLMNNLQGNTHIVDYLDHTFVDWSDETGFGRDMLIRMEKLSDLRSHISTGRMFSKEEVLKIGKDICAALTLCHKKGILHRDIKPENIFVNKDGNYKLGDFGISRIISASSAFASTGIGTPQYWAPEQISGHYDTRVDIYSLGLVLYELSNRNRLPFAESSYIPESAIHRRLLGEPFPVPCSADPQFAQLILKACAYKAEDRYQTAEELLSALHVLSNSAATPSYTTRPAQRASNTNGYSTILTQDTPNPDAYGTVFARDAAQAATYGTMLGRRDSTQPKYQNPPIQEYVPSAQPSRTTAPAAYNSKNSNNLLPWIIAALAVVLLAIVLFTKPSKEEDIPESPSSAPVLETEAINVAEKEETLPETTLTAPPIYLNELGYCAKNGKVWTRSNQVAAGSYHTAQDAPACWSDESTPGHTYGVVKDNRNNVYTYGIHIDGAESRTYTISFNLDGKYTTLSGVCACPARESAISSYVYNTSTHYKKYFEIYGDGELLLRLGESSYDGIPQTFSINVTGIRILTIQYPSTDGPNEIATLYDALLS